MFLQRFLISNLCNAFLICIMLGFKRILRNKISLRFQYLSWYALLASLTVSFLPSRFWLNLESMGPDSGNYFAISIAPETVSHTAALGEGWLHDTTNLAVNPSADWLASAIVLVWLLGVIVMLGVYWRGARKLRMIRAYAGKPAEDVQNLFWDCKQLIAPGSKVELKESRLISAPVSFGFHPNIIVLPGEHIHRLSQKELRHILLHELTHIRHGDLLTNYIVCALQALFWFNPFVWLAMGQLRRDREAYCDWTVINRFSSEGERIEYGSTIRLER